MTMEGDANGAPHPEPGAYAQEILRPLRHRLIEGGIGHNLPQEAPQAFARAVLDVDRLSRACSMNTAESSKMRALWQRPSVDPFPRGEKWP